MLAYTVTDIATIPEAARGFYKDEGGVFTLQVTGVVPETKFVETKSKLDEFRNNNTTLLKDQAKFKALASLIGEDGLDPDKLQARINALAEGRVGEMKTAYDAQVRDLSDKYAATSQQLNTLVLTDVVTREALKNGVTESAIVDVVSRASAAFEVVDGKVQAKNGVKNKKGDPLTISDWVTTLSETAPHFFASSSGIGAKSPITSTSQPALTTHEKLVAGLARLRK